MKYLTSKTLATLLLATLLLLCGFGGAAGPGVSITQASAIGAGQPAPSTAVLQTGRPERIVLNLTSTPATRQAVTWRTDAAVAMAHAQIAQAGGAPDFDTGARTVNARSESVVLADGRMVHHHSVIFDTLAPSTLYAYRVGGADRWSEWSQFRTADTAATPFSFIYFGDPQTEIHSKCTRVFRAAYQKAPDAAFWHFVGDLVNNGDRDEEWAEFFEALGWIPRVTPMIFLPGNHEYPDKRFVQGADYLLFHLWRPHFTLPENGPAGLEETVYFIDYQGARFVMLNGNEALDRQARWLERILSHDPQRWTIVAIHQPVHSAGRYRGQTHLQQLLTPIFDRHGVDLVLQGHDHVYSRSYKLHDGAKAASGEPGTVYVVSVSGPKSYPVNQIRQELMARTGSGRQLFQVVHVDQDRLAYQCFDAAGVLFDVFELEK